MTRTRRAVVVNLNDLVTVRLTKSGRAILDLSGYTMNEDKKFHLWELFRIFGHQIYMGMLEVPFEENSLSIEVDDDRQ
jgi:hypothetical protein